MTISANLYEIAVLLIALAVLIFVLALVPALLQLKRTIKAVEDLTIEGKRTVEGVNFIVRKAGDQVEDVEELVKKAKDLGMKVAGIADMVVENVKGPIISGISFLFGAEQGFKRFFSREKKGGGEDGKQ